MAKLSPLTAALHKGDLALVIIAVVNAAIAIYYYLGVVREAWFRDTGDLPRIRLDCPTRALCLPLIGGIPALGVAPAQMLDPISTSAAQMHPTLPADAPALSSKWGGGFAILEPLPATICGRASPSPRVWASQEVVIALG